MYLYNTYVHVQLSSKGENGNQGNQGRFSADTYQMYNNSVCTCT